LRRITGFQLPGGWGLQWQPEPSDADAARRVVAFLERRRVLFSTHTSEVPEECVTSVLAIADMLTEVLGEATTGRNLVGPLRMMRGACLTFLTRVGATEDRHDPKAGKRRLYREESWRMYDYAFGEALGELRAVVGLQVAMLAEGYNLDIDGYLAHDLARILPRDPESE
jgi:hypothetical protein